MKLFLTQLEATSTMFSIVHVAMHYDAGWFWLFGMWRSSGQILADNEMGIWRKKQSKIDLILLPNCIRTEYTIFINVIPSYESIHGIGMFALWIFQLNKKFNQWSNIYNLYLSSM